MTGAERYKDYKATCKICWPLTSLDVSWHPYNSFIIRCHFVRFNSCYMPMPVGSVSVAQVGCIYHAQVTKKGCCKEAMLSVAAVPSLLNCAYPGQKLWFFLALVYFFKANMRWSKGVVTPKDNFTQLRCGFWIAKQNVFVRSWLVWCITHYQIKWPVHFGRPTFPKNTLLIWDPDTLTVVPGSKKYSCLLAIRLANIDDWCHLHWKLPPNRKSRSADQFV